MAFSFRRILQGLNLIPKTTSTADSKGDLEVLDSSGKLNYHNGTTASPVTTEAHAATLTNKTIDADSNTITNIENADIKAGAAIDYAKLDLTNDIVNADINSAAAIARTKLASGTPYRVLANNASGIASENAALPSGTVIIADSNGQLTTETALSPTRGGTGEIGRAHV